MYIFHQFRKDIFREKQKTVYDNIIEKYRSSRGGRYLADKTSAATAASYTTIYTLRLTFFISFNIFIISCFIATLL